MKCLQTSLALANFIYIIFKIMYMYLGGFVAYYSTFVGQIL